MAAPVDTVLEVDTPEHLAFQIRIAGPARRLFAWLADLMVRAVIMAGLTLMIFLIFGSLDQSGIGTGLVFLASFVMDWMYFFFWEVFSGGRSAGKIWFRLRVVRTNGLPITWRESMLRSLLRAGDLLIMPPHYVLPLGPLVMALDPRFRRLGDLVAGTIVVAEEPPEVSRAVAVTPDQATLDDLPPTVPLDRQDVEALELFVHREHMSDARRDELAAIVSGEYARRVHLPPPRSGARFLAALWARSQGPARGQDRRGS